jgi:hypothetical protein
VSLIVGYAPLISRSIRSGAHYCQRHTPLRSEVPLWVEALAHPAAQAWGISTSPAKRSAGACPPHRGWNGINSFVIDRVVGVLAKVGRGLVGQTVHSDDARWWCRGRWSPGMCTGEPSALIHDVRKAVYGGAPWSSDWMERLRW